MCSGNFAVENLFLFWIKGEITFEPIFPTLHSEKKNQTKNAIYLEDCKLWVGVWNSGLTILKCLLYLLFYIFTFWYYFMPLS